LDELKLIILACSLTMVSLSGCQSGSTEPKATVGQVTGKVSFQGKPVEEGEIVFVNEQLRTEVVAPLGKDGAYSANGIVQGKCLVCVRPPKAPATMGPPQPAPDPANIPKQYRNVATSGLSLVTDTKAKTLDVDMTP
jgi:hypothetical protein